MAWNGSNLDKTAADGRSSGTRRAPSKVRGALALVIVLIIAALTFFLLTRMGETRPQATERQRTKAKVPTHKAKIRRVTEPVKETGNAKLDEKIRKLNEVDRTVEVEVTAAPAAPEEVIAKAQKHKRVFSSGVEQLMSIMFTCKPGTMPFPLIPIDKDDYDNLASILVSKNEVEEGDTDEIKYCKETVQKVKAEMISYIKQGGDPDEFMAYYHNILLKDFEFRNEAVSMAQETYEEDPKLAVDFVRKMNDKFDKDGIVRISLSDISGGDLDDDPDPNEPVEKENK